MKLQRLFSALTLTIPLATFWIQSSNATQLRTFRVEGQFENITYPNLPEESTIELKKFINGSFEGFYTLDIDNPPYGYGSFINLNDWNIKIWNSSGRLLKTLSKSNNSPGLIFSSSELYIQYSGNPVFSLPIIQFNHYDYSTKIGNILQLVFPNQYQNGGLQAVYNGSELYRSIFLELSNNQEYKIFATTSKVEIMDRNRTVNEPNSYVGTILVLLFFIFLKRTKLTT